MSRLRNTALFTFLVLLLAGKAYGGDVAFEFTIPTIPFTPEISSVSNSTIVAGQASFTVYATINGVEQKEVCCDPTGNAGTTGGGTCTHECDPDCDFSACGISDFYGKPDPRVVPNPTCIPSDIDPGGSSRAACSDKSNPIVHYYFNGDPTTGGSEDMTYDTDAQSFTADIPLAGYVEDDTVTWYFIVGDNMGNVTAQVPDPLTAPCTTLSSWDTNYETPAFDNCALMNVYSGIEGTDCGVMTDGTPTCASTYTINDPANDTCDKNQEPSIVQMDDILGISAGSGGSPRVVCSKIKLAAAPPNEGSSSGPIDAYVMVFFNPDIVDPNPNDVHMVNATAITFAPEAAGADPNLVRVLWDGECVTNPNTEDPLSCKLIVGGSGEERVKVGANSDELVFIAQNDLPNGDAMLGATSKMTRALIASGNIQLEGDTPFWLTDLTAGFAFIAKNQEGVLGQEGKPAAPLVVKPANCEWPDGTSHYRKCDQSDSKPTKNTCVLTINKSPDSGFVGEYKIYHSITANDSDPTEVGSITSNLEGQNTFSYDIDAADLDGFPHYFFLSALNSSGLLETDRADWTDTSCIVEDWDPPSAVTSLACATPATQENKCECTWVADTSVDPSLTGFKVWRDIELLTLTPTPAAIGRNDYNYTDSSEDLVLGESFTYSVKALDAGSNLSSDATASCTPEDLKDPARVDSLALSLVTGQLGINMAWTNNETDTDIAGYNVYWCHEGVSAIDCVNESDYTKLNGASMIPTTSAKLDHADIAAGDLPGYVEDNSYCFWVEACDNCDTEGNCPSNGGAPNCSNFSSTKTYMKCVVATTSVDEYYPDFPATTTVTAPAEGSKCKLEWDKVCSDLKGPFADCSFPTPEELSGYEIMRVQAGQDETDCSTTTVPDPSTATPVGFAKIDSSPSYTDTGLTNGTGYCYRVHAYDASGGFSRDNPPSPVFCKPMDTQAPALPEISTIGSTSISCSPSWDEVTDADTLVYSVHRCDDEPANCTTGDFSILGDATDIQDLTVDDIVPTSDVFYTYCVTAKDPNQNSSSIIDSSLTNADGSDNCGSCFPSDKPKPPTDGGAAAISVENNIGIEVWWIDSVDEDTSGQGYSVYICTNSSGSITEATCKTLATGVDGGKTSLAPYSLSDCDVDAEASYYAAITYTNGSGLESIAEFSPNAVSIEPSIVPPCEADPLPADCNITVSVSGAFKRVGLAEDSGTYTASSLPLTGVEVLVVADETDPGTYVAKKTVDSNGLISSFKIQESAISAGTQYNVVAKLPSGSYDDPYKTACKNSDPDTDGYCIIRLSRTSLEANTTVSAAAKVIPNASQGGYGGEIGNANGDGNVNTFDLAAIKNSMNTVSGDSCYKQWADFNLDGKVNLFDLGVLKDHMGEQFDATDPDFDPALVQSKDPLPAECN